MAALEDAFGYAPSARARKASDVVIVGGPREAVKEISRLLREVEWPSKEQVEQLWELAMDVALEARLQTGREDD
jgi:hypothetical protein